MVDAQTVSSIFSVKGALWSFNCLAMLALFRMWPHLPNFMAQWNERRRDIQAAKDADWKRIRDEVDRYSGRLNAVEDECESLRRAVQDCEEREIEWRRRALEAETLLLGQGIVRQAAAHAAAEVRLEARDEAQKERDK